MFKQENSNEILAQELLFPKCLQQCLGLEKNRELGEMVDKLADFYEDEATAAVKA